MNFVGSVAWPTIDGKIDRKLRQVPVRSCVWCSSDVGDKNLEKNRQTHPLVRSNVSSSIMDIYVFECLSRPWFDPKIGAFTKLEA